VSRIALVGRWDADVPPGVRRVPDAVGEAGPLGGLYSALLAAATPEIVMLAGDMPFVNAPLIRHLAEIPPGADAHVPRDAAGWHPLAGGYRRRIAAALKRRLDRGELRLVDALAALPVAEVNGERLRRLDPGGLALTNVNTPDDYDAAAARARLLS
jgi:molybdopterin-guanine dinucleotide biosynthesis protein A